MNRVGIATGGEPRLREAIEAEVRREYQKELFAATEHSQRETVEEEIRIKVEERIRRVASPYSLWISGVIGS